MRGIIYQLFVVVAVFIGVNGYAQCSKPTVDQQDFCLNQRAEIRLTDAASNVKYHWYEKVGSVLKDNFYGFDGEGRYFVSNTPISVTSDQKYFYIKESNYLAGPAYRAPAGGGMFPISATTYDLTFDAALDFTLDSLTVVVEMTDAASDYMFEVFWKHGDGSDSAFSVRHLAPRSDFEQISGNIYKVRFPTFGLEIPAGTGHKLEFRSVDDSPGSAFRAVDNIYWWGAGEYPGGSYAGGSIDVFDPEDQVTSQTRTPLMMDWDVTVLCPLDSVIVTLSTDCCTPVGDDFEVTSPAFKNVVRPGELPLDITAAGTDVNGTMHYYWYDENDVLISNGAGQNTLNVSAVGLYTVRVVRDPSDINSAACFARRSIILSDASVFTSGDQTICMGDPLTLSASGAEGGYLWSSADLGGNGTILTPDMVDTKVYITNPGIYNFEVEADVKLGNIAVDGKFQEYDDATNYNLIANPPRFETTYGNALGGGGDYITNNGQFRVDDEIRAWCTTCTPTCNTAAFWERTDPISGDVVTRDNILYADGHTSGANPANSVAHALDKYLWQLSNQPVVPNTDYEFSMDVVNWETGDPAVFMMLVNGSALTLTVDGTPTGSTTYAVGGTCTWHTVTGTWNSGTNTSATITVSEVGKQNIGHEMAVDEITFSTGIGRESAFLEVTVDNCNNLVAGPGGAVCAGDPFTLTLTQNTGFLIDWTDSNGDVVATTETATIYPSQSEVYTARVKFPVINFIENGDFESDNSLDFETDASLPTGSAIESGNYYVDNGNTSLLHSSMATGQSDHTLGTTSGNMYLMRFSPNEDIIRKTISVTDGQDYAFSAWFKHFHRDATNSNARDYNMELYVDGNLEYSFVIPKGQDWTEYSFNWTSTVTGNITVNLRSPDNINESGLAIDDISLAQLGFETTDNISTTVSVCQFLNVSDDGCVGSTRTATATTDGIFTGWYDASDNLVETALQLDVVPATNEDYTAKISIALAASNDNGNMDGGNTGYNMSLSDRTGNNQLYPNNEYMFVTNISSIAGEAAGAASVTDYDGTGGQYLVSMPNGGNNKQIMRTAALPLTDATTYVFDFAVALLENDPTDMTVTLNKGGVAVETYTLSSGSSWQEFSYSFTQSGNASEDFELLVNRGNNYNEYKDVIYGIDGVYLRPTTPVLEETLTLAPCCSQLQPTAAGASSACVGETLTLTATANAGSTGPFTYQWYQDGVAISGEVGATYDVPTTAAAIASDYTVTVTSSASCTGESPESTPVTVTINGTPSVGATATPSATVCAGTDITLSGSGAASYSWTGGVTDATAFTPTTQTYTVTGTDANNCTNTFDVDVTVNPLPTVTGAASPNATVCAGVDITLSGSGATSYSWTGGATDGVAFTPSSQTYTVTGTDANNCSNTADVVVTVNPLPTVTAASDPVSGSICGGENVDLNAGGAASYSWDNGAGTGATVTVSPSSTTTYEVTGTDANNCENTAQVTITVNALPTITSYTGGGDLCKEATSATLDLALTGAAPFTVNYEVDGNPEAPLTGEPASASISPVVAAAIVPGVYEVTSITDANNCTANITGQTQTVAVIPDVSVTVSDASCDFNTKDATVTFTVTGGDGAYSAGSTQTPVAGSFATDTYTATFAAIGSTAYDYTFSDGSGCADNTNQTGIANTINCDCPVQAEIRLATGSPSAICADGSITTLEVEVSGSVQATPNYTFTITYPTGTLSETDAVSVAGDVYTFEVSAEGPYTISTVADQQCTGSGTGSVDVTVNPLPVATFDPTSQAICDDNTATASVLLDVTVGTAPLQYDIDGPEASGGLVALQSHAPMTDGIYSLLQLRDANGCDMATPADAGTFEVTYIQDPQITNVTTMCSSNNPNPSDPGPFYYYLTVEAQDGDQASYNVELTLDDNSTIANAAGTWVAGVWTMDNEDAIDENRTITSITLRDVNDCNTFTYSTATGQVCSCAETVDLSLTGSDSVCVLGTPTTSSLDLTFNDGGTGATSWNFQLLDQDDQVIEDFSGTPFIGTTHSVSNLPAGTYRVEGFQGNCAGKATSDLTIYEYASPAASITGTTSICDDATTTAQIDITPTAGVGPFTVSYAVDGGTAQANGTALTYQSNEFGVHTIAAITDANGCDADPADLTGSATLSGVTPPVAQIQSWNDGDVSTINNVPTTYSAVAAGVGYNGAWTASDPTKGTNAGDDFTVTSALDYDQSVDLTWTLSDDGNLCPASTSTITVERRNITGAGPIPEDTICGPQAYTFTPASLPNTGLGEDGEWTADAGSPAVTFNPTTYELSTTFAAPGDYTFTYRIFNNTILDGSGNPIESQATLTVRVDNVVVTPTAGTDAVVCSEPYTLSGSALNADESGLWTAAGLTFTDETSNASGVSGLTEGVPTTLTWTVSSKYEECASESATVELTKAQDLTDATITPNDADSTYCISGANQGTPVLTTLPVNPANGETGTWSSSDVTINAGDLNTNSLDLTSYNLTSGQYSLTWTVSSSNCSDTKVDDIVITITDVPDVSAASLTFDDGCEGTTVNGVVVTGVTNADSYSWTAVSGGQVGTSSTSTTTFILETGGATSAEVSVVPSNDKCGVGTAVTATNTIRVVPRIPGAIDGPTEICRSVDPVQAYTIEAHPEATGYAWTVTGLTGVADATGTAVSLDFTNATSGSGQIEVTLSNDCGDGDTQVYPISSLNPEVPTIEIESDKDNQNREFCLGVDDVTFSAVNQQNGGNNPTYQFEVNLTGETSTDSPSNTFTTSTIINSVRVIMTSDSKCALTPTATAEIVMNPVNQPDAQTTALATSACEGESIMIDGSAGPNATSATPRYQWYNESGILVNETSEDLTTSTVGDHEYYFTYDNGVCPEIESSRSSVKIWETPRIDYPTWLGSGFKRVIQINEESPEPFNVDITASNLNIDAGTEVITWTGEGIGNSSEANTDVTLSEEGTYNYVVTVATGDNQECFDQLSFTLVGRVPLRIPNAFSPNGDDINDKWVIPGISTFSDCNVKIFNRWGNKIFEVFGGYDELDAWDGEGFPIGTYYYIININEDGYPPLTGAVTITK